MSILLSNEIISAVVHELRLATESVQIITAYCKENIIRQLNSYILAHVQEKRIMLRFRLDDIVKGSTDFSVIEFCRSQGWSVFIRFDLHAKTYIVDRKRGFIGSANATNMGLGLAAHGNMEMGTLIDIDAFDMEKIETLYEDAIFVDDVIYCKLEKQYHSMETYESGKQYAWNDEIRKLFNPKITTLFSHELPDKEEFNIGEYIPFMDIAYSGNLAFVKDSFRWSNAYLWLLDILGKNDGCLYFGELTEKLHSSLVSDPKPYRKDVKQLLSNLLKIIDFLQMEEVVIDRPNYSQRVRLKEMC